MSEGVFITGLMLSMLAMFVLLAIWNRRTRAPPRPLRIKLGSPMAWQALAAVLGCFVVGGVGLFGLAVLLETTLPRDGALYAMWAIPWIIPPMLPAARWGLERAAPGEVVVDGPRLRIRWGSQEVTVSRDTAALSESVAPHPQGGVWQVHIDGGTHPMALAAPMTGLFGVKQIEKLREDGVADAPRDPAALNLLADLHEILALRDALFGRGR